MSNSAPIATPEEFVHSFFLASQLDSLHLSLISLLEMVQDDELDLVLSQSSKTDASKQSFLEKVLSELSSAQLQDHLRQHLKSQGPSFFLSATFLDYLRSIQSLAEKCQIIKLVVALKFKDASLIKMANVLSERTGKQIVLELTVDPTLMGGVILQYGSKHMDYSIRTQLDQVRTSWKHASVQP